MKITDIQIVPFRWKVDRYRHGTPLPKVEVMQTILKILTDEGVEGYYFGGGSHGDEEGLPEHIQQFILNRVKPMLVGQDPLDREKFWKWLWVMNAPEHVTGVVDMALWDLAGRHVGLPVHKILGGARDKIQAYGSTYPNMGSPENYAEHALALKQQGYKAYKIHPYYFWNPETGQPVPGRPSHIKWDIKCCEAVREAVGDDMVLMYDPWGTYHTVEEAIKVGKALERLDFYWYEHPMPEYRVESYVRLSRELTIPILSPEITEGTVFTRADWIHRGASDMTRMDVNRGGITAAKKTAIVAEAYGVKCEIHMSGWGNLQLLGSVSEDTCEYYEKGLLAPGVDYDAVPPYLREAPDPIDADGYVTIPTKPGLGYDIVWDYIEEHRIRTGS